MGFFSLAGSWFPFHTSHVITGIALFIPVPSAHPGPWILGLINWHFTHPTFHLPPFHSTSFPRNLIVSSLLAFPNPTFDLPLNYTWLHLMLYLHSNKEHCGLYLFFGLFPMESSHNSILFMDLFIVYLMNNILFDFYLITIKTIRYSGL